MLFVTIPAVLVFLTQLPLILCSLLVLHPRTASNPRSRLSKQEIMTQTMGPKLFSRVVIHAYLFWVAMGLLMPLGVLVMRNFNTVKSGKRLKILFYTHTVTQSLSVFLVTVGAILSFKDFQNVFNNGHQRLGLAVYCLVWMQFLVGMVRPDKGSKGRVVWYVFHWFVGTSVTVLGIVSVYTGLYAFHQKTSKNARVWLMLFTIQLSFIILIYLIQEKWEYIKKQIMAPSQANEHELLSKQKEPLDA